MYDDAFDRGKLIEKFIDIINELMYKMILILNNELEIKIYLLK